MNKHEQKIKSIQELLEKNEAHLASIEKFSSQFNKINQDIEKLKEYYTTEWMADYEKKTENHYSCMNQDTIWNVLESYHKEKLKIIKAIINSLK